MLDRVSHQHHKRKKRVIDATAIDDYDREIDEEIEKMNTVFSLN